MRRKKRAIVISNDAGASEYIAYLILYEIKTINWKIFAFENSPASKIFDRLKLPYKVINNIQTLHHFTKVLKPDFLLYGTGLGLDFSKPIKKLSKQLNIESYALIDHWTLYGQRFKKNCLSDNIIVMDKYAKKIALRTFKNKTKIVQLKNYFFENMIDSFKFNKERKCTVFISEPTSAVATNHFGYEKGYGFTEYEVAKDILNYFDNIIIRLHPLDEEKKYDDLIKEYPKKNISIVKPYEEKLTDTLSKSFLTIGFDGMALFISHILGIKSISYMPNSNRKLTIPIPRKYKVKNFNELLSLTHSKFDVNSLQKGTKIPKKGLSSIL